MDQKDALRKIEFLYPIALANSPPLAEAFAKVLGPERAQALKDGATAEFQDRSKQTRARIDAALETAKGAGREALLDVRGQLEQLQGIMTGLEAFAQPQKQSSMADILSLELVHSLLQGRGLASSRLANAEFKPTIGWQSRVEEQVRRRYLMMRR